MIEKIELKNFQSHKHSILEFSSGVNIIVGTSDSGKSAIIRGLRWLVEGKPRGDAFRSHWGGDTEINIDTPQGVIQRRKTNTQNQYILNTNGQTTEYNAIGTDIPDEVIQVLNFDSLNIQQQLDSPFLINETPGEVAQHFNRIAQLEKIDTSRKAIQSEITRMEGNIKHKEADLKEIKQKYEQYDYLTDAEEDITSLEGQQLKMETKESLQTQMVALTARTRTVQEAIQKECTVLEAEPYLLDIQKLIDTLQSKETMVQELGAVFTKVQNVSTQIISIRKTNRSEIHVLEIEGLYNKWGQQHQQRMKMKGLLNTLTGLNVTINNSSKLPKAAKVVEQLFEDDKRLLQIRGDLNKLKKVIINLCYVVDDIKTYTKQSKELENQYTIEMQGYTDCPVCQHKLK